MSARASSTTCGIGTRHLMGVALSTTLILACSSLGPEPPKLSSGSYSLVSLDGKPVPVDFGPMSDRVTGLPTSCRLLLTKGALQLNAEAHTYSFGYEFHNSCDDRLMSNPTASGPFDQRAESLFFQVVATDTTFRFSGLIEPTTILVDDGSQRFRFRR